MTCHHKLECNCLGFDPGSDRPPVVFTWCRKCAKLLSISESASEGDKVTARWFAKELKKDYENYDRKRQVRIR